MKTSYLARYAWHVVRMHLQHGYRIPLNIEIELTYRCNNRCVYCRTYKLPQKDILTTQIMKDLLKEMKSCGTQRVHFTGGEIMLRDDIGELISYAKNLGFFVGIVTSGHRVAERINELKGVDLVFVSYEGPPSVHGRIRGASSVAEVESAFEALLSMGIRVWTTTVLNRWNADYIDDIVTFVRDHSMLATFKIMEFYLEPPANLHPLMQEVQDLILTAQERKEVFNKLIRMKKSGAPIASSIPYLRNTIEWPYNENITDSAPSKNFKCFAGRAYGILAADGLLYGCCWDVGRVPGSNV
ncbi:MAG: radical SAM protein, partial [Spirochaetes bacterium]|nr:radical SAM protein [Spirochaetota bacterium]